MKKKITITVLMFLTSACAQISLTGTGTYFENFNSLAESGISAVLPSGWFHSETGSNSDSFYTAGSGSGNKGDTYSFGPANVNDRALGTLRDINLFPVIGAQFINNTGSEITQLPVSYTGEQWRRGLNLGTDRLDFQISTDAMGLNSGTWIDVDSLDFISQNSSLLGGELDGNLPQNREEITYTIPGLNIADGQAFWIRWVDFYLTTPLSTDDGLSVDDFSIDQAALPVELTSFSGTSVKNLILLKWQTSTEVDNLGFDIERCSSQGNSIADSADFIRIAFVKGNGNSNSVKNYSYEDNSLPVYGKYFYRLKQIDNNGSFSYSNIIDVKFSPPHQFNLKQNYPNPFNPSTKIHYTIPAPANSGKQEYNVTLKIYNVLGNEVETLVNENKPPGEYAVEFNGTNFPSGVYYYKLQMGAMSDVKKMLLLK